MRWRRRNERNLVVLYILSLVITMISSRRMKAKHALQAVLALCTLCVCYFLVFWHGQIVRGKENPFIQFPLNDAPETSKRRERRSLNFDSNSHLKKARKIRKQCIRAIRNKHNDALLDVIQKNVAVHGASDSILLIDPAYHNNVGMYSWLIPPVSLCWLCLPDSNLL